MRASYEKAKGRETRDAKHMRLYAWMLNSEAWQSLDCHARCALIELCRCYNGCNNGDIYLSQRELARRLNVSRTTATKALDQLQDRGFIALTERGSFTRKVRHASCWRLTEFAYNDRPATKEFMRWGVSDDDTLAEAA